MSYIYLSSLNSSIYATNSWHFRNLYPRNLNLVKGLYAVAGSQKEFKIIFLIYTKSFYLIITRDII